MSGGVEDERITSKHFCQSSRRLFFAINKNPQMANFFKTKYKNLNLEQTISYQVRTIQIQRRDRV